MVLLTSNASALLSGLSFFKEGKVMKIKMLRDTIVDGKAVSVGDDVKCSDEEGIKLIQMGKAKPAAEKAKKPSNREGDQDKKLSTR